MRLTRIIHIFRRIVKLKYRYNRCLCYVSKLFIVYWAVSKFTNSPFPGCVGKLFIMCVLSIPIQVFFIKCYHKIPDFYYTCSYTKADYFNFMNTTASSVLNLIPEKLQSQSVFLCIINTMVSKFGKTFENIAPFFATHNGSNFFNNIVLWALYSVC